MYKYHVLYLWHTFLWYIQVYWKMLSEWESWEDYSSVVFLYGKFFYTTWSDSGAVSVRVCHVYATVACNWLITQHSYQSWTCWDKYSWIYSPTPYSTPSTGVTITVCLSLLPNPFHKSHHRSLSLSLLLPTPSTRVTTTVCLCPYSFPTPSTGVT